MVTTFPHTPTLRIVGRRRTICTRNNITAGRRSPISTRNDKRAEKN
jgi:hypothetical protein